MLRETAWSPGSYASVSVAGIGACSGSAKAGAVSACHEARTGSSSAPPCTVSVTGSGEGHAHGQ